MAIDLFTGEHICIGLSIGSGCASCREKYAYRLATTPEQIEAGKRNLLAAISAYENHLNGERPVSDAELNSYAHFVPPSPVEVEVPTVRREEPSTRKSRWSWKFWK